MPVDTTPAQSATSLLNGIDYSALIGGPLQAAVTAQAMAANSTWDFIQQVGLNPVDAEGNRTAINVTFLYQKDGELVKMIVPLITIVPIPLIVVNEIAIDFTANINASASSTTEDSSATDIGGELSAEGKIGWGPFSLTARVKASYSSKQASKATQDSRYSVEYTQRVSVKAGQADVPAGLATVLNILSTAATGASRNGELLVSPAQVTVVEKDVAARQQIQLRAKNSNGLWAAGTEIKLAINATFENSFEIYDALKKEKITPTAGVWTVTTDKRGTFNGLLAVTDTAFAAGSAPYFTITATIKPDTDEQVDFLPVTVLAAPTVLNSIPGPGVELVTLKAPRLQAPANELLALPSESSQSWQISMTGRRQGDSPVPIRVSYDRSQVIVLQNGEPVNNDEQLRLDNEGRANISFLVAEDARPGLSQVTLNASIGDTAIARVIPIKID
jgi:hypothetical protein